MWFMPSKSKIVQLVASGDLRLSANQTCWPAQAAMEEALGAALKAEGWEVKRAHALDTSKKHGFIDSQRMGIEVFRGIDPEAPLIVAEAVWQYSHHVLAGLTTHRGPILTVANWSGQWPGLVGMLNLNGSLTKAGVKYSTLWSEDFTVTFFKTKLKQWLKSGSITHDLSHVQKLEKVKVPAKTAALGKELAATLRADKAIMGIFDEGCMGMFNAIIPDHALHACGVFKERLSQSALYHETMQVSDSDALAIHTWVVKHGMTFQLGDNHAMQLTRDQVRLQCKMYAAALRIADDFGCDAIGIQYQQGLKDLLPASDLVEGMLNNSDRPPVKSRDRKRTLLEGQPLLHFNDRQDWMKWFQAAGLTDLPPLRGPVLDQDNMVIDAAVDGQGVALLPNSETKAELLAGNLVRVLPQWQGLPREIYAVWPSGRLLNKKALCLREHMKHYIGEHCD